MVKAHKEYLKAKELVKKKMAAGLPLKPSELMAQEGRWFFTIPLDIDVIDSIVEHTKYSKTKPSEMIEFWILQKMVYFGWLDD